MNAEALRLPALLAGLGLISSTAGAQSTSSSTAQSKTPPTTAALEARIQLLETRIKFLATRVAQTGASLDCDSKRFSEFQLLSNTLVFLAACTNVEPYLEGYKVTVQVNNPYAVRFSDISGTLGYGKTFEESLERNVDVSTTVSLSPGTWTPITVNVNPAKAEDLRFIELNLSVKSAGGM